MTHNPYAPPVAPVADSNTAAAIVRPWQVKYGIYSLWVSFVFGTLSFLLVPEMIGIRPGDELLWQVISSVFFLAILAFYFLLIVCIGWGHRWARIVYAGFVVWNLIDAWQGLGSSFARSWVAGAVYLLAEVTDVAGVVLLFTWPANAWFRNLAAWRRAN